MRRYPRAISIMRLSVNGTITATATFGPTSSSFIASLTPTASNLSVLVRTANWVFSANAVETVDCSLCPASSMKIPPRRQRALGLALVGRRRRREARVGEKGRLREAVALALLRHGRRTARLLGEGRPLRALA